MRARDVPSFRDTLLADITHGRWRGMQSGRDGKFHAFISRYDQDTSDEVLVSPYAQDEAPLDAGFAATERDLDRWLDDWANGAMSPTVRVSELFYVNAAMIRLAREASLAMPAYELAREDLPAQCGLLVWELPQVAVLPIPEDLEALRRDPQGFVSAGVLWRDTGSGVHLTHLIDLWPWIARNQSRQTADAWMQNRPRYLPLVLDRVAYGELIEDPTVLTEAGYNMLHVELMFRLRRLLVATWLLMGQEIVVQGRWQPRSKAALHRAARTPLPSAVRTITLRHVTHDPEQIEAHLEGKGRVYRHRWYVRGHWRNQYYPSTGTHRPVWIPSYLKGPDGAPLLTGTVVKVLSR